MAEQHSQTSDYQNRWKFTGHELDRETGLYYAGARYYDPRVSIWLSVDPLAEKFPNWNPYNYVMQNPINLIDPTGMSPEYGNKDGDIQGPLTFSQNKAMYDFNNKNILNNENLLTHSDVIMMHENISYIFDNVNLEHSNVNTQNSQFNKRGVPDNVIPCVSCHHITTFFGSGFSFSDRQSGFIEYGGSLNSQFIGDKIVKDGVLYGVSGPFAHPGASRRLRFQWMKNFDDGFKTLNHSNKIYDSFKIEDFDIQSYYYLVPDTIETRMKNPVGVSIPAFRIEYKVKKGYKFRHGDKTFKY